MALAIASGFLLQSTAPNFERDMFSTIVEMKSYPDASLPDVFVSTCVEDGCVYCYNRTNEALETTGKWRKVGSGDSNIWIGTTAEYEAAATLGTIPVGTLVFITDDTADGADTGIIYDTELSATSENAVTNKAIKEALDKKVDVVEGKGLSTYDFNDTAYNKLDGIQAGANKTVLDTVIQESNNPVTNTAIKTAIQQKELELTELKMLGWTVPKECPVQNTVSGNTFTQKVGRKPAWELVWNRYDNYFFSSIASLKGGTTQIYTREYIYSPNRLSDKTINTGQPLVVKQVSIVDSSYTDVDSFVSHLQSTNAYIYYELETPITKQIDGNEIGTYSKIKIGTFDNASTSMVFTVPYHSAEWCIIGIYAGKIDQEISRYKALDSFFHYQNTVELVRTTTSSWHDSDIYVLFVKYA